MTGPMEPHASEPPRLWPLMAAFWAGCALLAAAVLAAGYGMLGESPWKGAAIALDDTAWYGLLAVAAYASARRFPAAGERRVRNVLACAACMVVLDVAWSVGLVAWWAYRPWWPMQDGGGGIPLREVGYMMGQGTLMLIPIFVCAQGLVLMEMRRVQEVREAALRGRLARVQLQAVRQQLRPEFLFGVFDSVSERMLTDRAAADAMLSRVAELLRFSLRHAAADEVALQEEWRFTELYLQIECARLDGRLRYEARMDPRAQRLRIPHMVLQPLVENAVLHGAGARGGGTVEVTARPLPDGALGVEVLDDGPGFAAGADPAAGAGGIARACEHLDRLYGPRYALRFGNRPGGGARVSLVIPQPAPAAAPRPPFAFPRQEAG